MDYEKAKSIISEACGDRGENWNPLRDSVINLELAAKLVAEASENDFDAKLKACISEANIVRNKALEEAALIADEYESRAVEEKEFLIASTSIALARDIRNLKGDK